MPTIPNAIYGYRISTKKYDDVYLDSAYESEATLHIIADGYSNANTFRRDCYLLVENLKKIAPFGELAKSSLFKVWSYYEDAPAGYAFPIVSTPPSPLPTTPLGAYFQSALLPSIYGNLSVNYDRFVTLGKRLRVFESDANNDYIPSKSEWPALLAGPDNATTSSSISQFVGGAIIILFPEEKPVNLLGSPWPLSDAERFRIEMEHTPTQTEPIYFAATTCNKGFERIAARAIALKLGLGDESEQVTQQTSQLPVEQVGQYLDTFPNLIYAPTPTDADTVALNPKWQAIAGQSTFTVHRKSTPTGALPDETSSLLLRENEPIGLWEGGGGFTNGIYRPTHECLMRRKPGVGTLGFKASQQPFCPVCRVYLIKAITGEYSTKRAADSVTLSTQRSEYAKVRWNRTETYNPQRPTDASFVVNPSHELFRNPEYVRPANYDPYDPEFAKHPLAFWGYTCHVNDKLDGSAKQNSNDPLTAFYFDQVRVHQSQYYAGPAGDKTKVSSLPQDARDVFSRLGFHSLKVTFENPGGTVPPAFEFVIADYIRPSQSDPNKSYELKRSWGGRIGGDHLYQTGWQLVLTENRPGWPCLQVALSLVTRGPAPDFDPGGVPVALKCYPQITFKWTRKTGVAVGVKQFEGTVRAVVNTKHYMHDPFAGPNHFIPGHGMGRMGCLPSTSNWNDVSCFADSNISAKHYYNLDTLLRRQDVEYPAPFTKPTWAAIFDYYAPHVAQGKNGIYTKNFVGAYRQDPTTRGGKVRKMFVAHKITDNLTVNDGRTPLFITKFARQGGYDNMHVNGYMGVHQAFADDPLHCDESQIIDEEIVAAPFCGLDCFHFHWRWSLLSDTIATATSVTNGRLFNGWATAPSYRGWDATRSHSQIGAVLIPPNQHLDIHLEALTHNPIEARLDKVMEYKVTVSNPAPGESQVILEQGMGWAMIESNLLAAKVAVIAALVAPPLPPALSPGFFPAYLQEDPEAHFYKLYDYIRFHHSFFDVYGDLIPTVIPPIALPHLITFRYADKMVISKYSQVPSGTIGPTLIWPAGAANPLATPDYALLQYRLVGDPLNLQTYTSNKQILVEGNDFAGISIEDM